LTGCHLVQTAAASRSLADDYERLEVDNRRLQSTITDLKSRLTEEEFNRDELEKDIDKQKQENSRWLVLCKYIPDMRETSHYVQSRDCMHVLKCKP